MQLFFKCESEEDEVYLENHEIIEYEYQSSINYDTKDFCLKIYLMMNFLDRYEIDYIRKWTNKNYKDEDFYRQVSVGIVFNKEIIKEITFFDAYLDGFRQECNYEEGVLFILLVIKQKKDKFKNIMIVPSILATAPNKSNIIKNLQENFNLDMMSLSLEYRRSIEIKNIKLFKEKLSKQQNITKEYEQVLLKKFACASECAQNLFLKYVPDNSVKYTNIKEGEIPQYLVQEKGIKMNFKNDLTNSRGPGVTYFHEHGHLIDYIAVNPGDEEYLGVISSDKEFLKTLKQDFEDCVQEYQIKYRTSRMGAYFKISEILYDGRYSVISDLFGVMSNGLCQGRYTHSPQFWANVKNGLQEEAVAHFFEVQFDPNRLDIVKGFFPKSMARFEKLLLEMDTNYAIF